MKTGTLADRQRGVMYGLAYGDALGRPTEFLKTASLAKFGNPFRTQVGLNRPTQGIVTDDTQMSIAVARATLVNEVTPGALTTSLIAEFIRWYDDPKSRDGKRAPGATCLTAVGALKRNPRQWLLATDPRSKGCGANMRVAPIGLRTDWTWDEMGAAAQLQSAITHGHATALAASHLTAAAVRMLLEGIAQPTESLLDHLLAFCHDQRRNYYGEYLGHLWEASSYRSTPWAGATGRLWESDPTWPVGAFRKTPVRPIRSVPESPREFIERGWDKMIDTLLGIYGKPRTQTQDPCDVAGGGWIAEEALACALHTLLCFPDNPTDALRRAAFSDGDSDSIASITGALAGAAYGRSAFPGHWVGNMEYRRELDSVTARLARAASCS